MKRGFWIPKAFAIVASALLLAGCDMNIANLNSPDRERALNEPGDVLTLAGSAFRAYWVSVHQVPSASVINHFMNYGSEMTTTVDSWSLMSEMAEPRGTLDNDPAISVIGPVGPRFLWRELLRTASIPYDVLSLQELTGAPLRDSQGNDVTARTRAYLKLIQGFAWGYLAVIYDQAPLLEVGIELESDPLEQMPRLLKPYPEVLAAAIAALDEAIAISQQNTFTFPTFPDDVLWFGSTQTITNQDLAAMANTLAARFLVLAARTPAQRRQVDWNRVLQYTANGVTRDYTTSLQQGVRTSTLYQRLRANTLYRWDMRLLGHGDISGQHQSWISAANSERNRYNMVTPDRRITGPTPTSHGAYTRYRADNNGFDAAFGGHLFSAYQWSRHAYSVGIAPTSASTGNNVGTARFVSVDENRLLRAEALIYTGSLQAAANLINETRTRSHTLPNGQTYPGLPAVTPAGVPHSAPAANDCAPRKNSGECGDLMTALWWERMIELAGLDVLRGFADSRAFGLFVDGSYVHFPVPGNELDVVGLPTYTFGGAGTAWGAVYSPVDMSNVP